MPDHLHSACLSCGRTQAQIPLTLWWYQNREVWLCPQCTPAFIHKTDQVLAKLAGSDFAAAPDAEHEDNHAA